MKSHLLLMVLVTIAVASHSSHALFGRYRKYDMMWSPSAVSTPAFPPDRWFTQRLDHFDPTNHAVWQQRYLVVSDFYQEGKAAFLMISGESKMNSAWMVSANWINYAKQHNALMLQLEHRFYGESHPTSDMGTENLRFLTSEQALADIANFISVIEASYNLPPRTKWIVFGGSYAGNLAAWARLKYPHLIHGAMSASGPVLAKVDFNEYMDVVRDSLATYDLSCPQLIIQANQLILKLLKTKSGQEEITTMFRLCSRFNSSSMNDLPTLLEALADGLAFVVQYNKDNRGVSRNITIDTICDIMADTSLGSPVQRFAAINSLLLDTFGEECLNNKYDDMIMELKNISWTAPGEGWRQWTYQTCTEFGYFQTSERKDQLFGNDFPLQYFVQQCSDIFGEEFTRDVVLEGANRTNIMYGGLNSKATRVVYVHGSIDPWHVLGITQTKKEASTAIFINGTAHCANMYPPADTDPPALIAARKQVGKFITKWLQDP